MRTAIACGALVVLASCGGNSPDINTTQDNVCDQIAEVACFDMYQCCSEGEIENALMVSDPRTESDCQSDLRTRCKRQVADLDFSIKNKHVRFDSKVMDACLKEFVAPSGTCVTVESAKPWAMACMTGAWVGIVDVGGACDFSYECAKDSFCAPNRMCTALPTENMPCSTQGACASGLFCDFAVASGPVCHALLGAGAACTANAQCQKDLFCDLAAPVGMRNCTPLLANGATCQSSLACTSTLCLTGTCSVTGFSCTTDATCEGRCSNNNTFCLADSQCGNGTCSGTATPCTLPTDCTVAGSTCVFPKCNLGTCMGNVCADPHLTIDYCKSTLTDLPLLGTGQVVGGPG
jgi:hypothetical protein